MLKSPICLLRVAGSMLYVT